MVRSTAVQRWILYRWRMDVVRIKALDNWTLDVLSAPYGGPDNGRDAHGEYFSPDTNFYLNDGAPLPLVVYYHSANPDGSPQGEPEIIGRAVKVWQDGRGLWHRVVLDPSKDLARRVWDAAKQGIARASTGVAGYMMRRNRDGKITHWLIGELSIWDASADRRPANDYAVARPAVKALFEEAGFTLDSQGDATGRDRQEHPSEPSIVSQDHHSGGIDMGETVDTITREEAQALAEQAAIKALADKEARDKAEQDAADAEKQRTDAAVKAAREEWEKEHAAERRLPTADDVGAPYVAKFKNIWKYDNMDDGDLSFMAQVLAADNQQPSEDALKALAIRVAESTGADEQRLRRVKAMMVGRGMSLKANELNQSTLASYGDEWVGVAYSTQLWERVNDEATILPNLPTIEVPQGTESVTIPIQSTPPTFYKVAQASAQDTDTKGKATYTHTSSKMGTGSQSLTVGKLGARTLYTGELEEDSLIMWAAELRASMELEAANILDSLFIDGDTATGATTNINDIAGTPGGTEYWLVANGARKLALVTNTANSRSGGTLTVEDFIETVRLMGLQGKNAMDKTKVAFIIDAATSWKVLQLTEVRTRDVFSAPTIENGSLTGLWGYRVLSTPNMHRSSADTTYGLLANSAGKVDQDTASNNAYGAILAVRWDQWRFGWKRRPKFETQRIPQADATDVVLNMRVGITYRDTEASAITYGVTV